AARARGACSVGDALNMGALTWNIVAAMGAAFFIVLLAVPILRAPAHQINLVDHPGGRKRHACAVPMIGGLAMFAGFGIALMLVEASLRPFASLLAGMGLLLMVGVIDDLIDIKPGAKLFAQIIAALLMTSWGVVQVGSLGDLVGIKPIELGEWAIPFTVLCTVLLINAVNMADGSDGL